MTIYYISPTGNDINDGLTEATPWQTPAAVIENLAIVGGIPGDEYLFEGGKDFTTNEGFSIFSGIDSDAEPIVFSSYGFGGRARIAFTANTTGFTANDVNVVIKDINISGIGTASTLAGIILFGFNSSKSVVFQKTKLSNCNITGFYTGVFVSTYVLNAGMYRNVILEDLYIYKINNEGINSFVDRSNGDTRYNQLLIRRCKIEEVSGVSGPINSGSLIVLGQCSDSEISDCIGIGNSANIATTINAHNHNAFWYYGSINCSIKRCKVSKMEGSGTDNGAYGADIDCESVTIEQNYAYDCEGNGVLIMNAKNTVVRYNVIVNCCKENKVNQAGIQHFGSNANSTAVSLTSNAKIYNNLVVMPPSSTNSAFSHTKVADKSELYNNIFVVQNASEHIMRFPTFTTGSAVLQNNCYYDTTSVDPTWLFGSTTYTGIVALRAAGYEKIGSVNVGMVTDPGVTLTFGSYKLKNFVPQSSTIRTHEPPEIASLDYDLLIFDRIKDVSGYRVFESQLGPFAMGNSLANVTTSGGGGAGDATASNQVAIKTVVDAIKLKTDSLTFTVANQVDSNTQTGIVSSADIYSYFTSSSRADAFKATGFSTLTAQQVWEYATRTITDKLNFGLSAASITAIEAALLNEGDGQQLINAILQVINTNLDLPTLELTAIANAVRTNLATELARIDANVSSRSDFDPSADTVARVTLVDTNADMRGTDGALTSLGTNAPTNWINAGAIATDAVTKVQSGLSTFDGDLTPITSELTSIKGATFNSSTDSLEAIRDRGDAAWTSGGGASASDIYDYFTAGSREDTFKADLSGVSALVWNHSGSVSTALKQAFVDSMMLPVTGGADAVAIASPASLIGLVFSSYLDLLNQESTVSGASVAAIVAGVGGAIVIPDVEDIRQEMDANSTQLAAIKSIALSTKALSAAAL